MIRVQVAKYIDANKKQIKSFIVEDFNLNANKIRDSYYWGDNQKICYIFLIILRDI